MQIGTFKKDGAGYSGEIRTLTVRVQVTLEPNRTAGNFAFHVMHGLDEIGVALKKSSQKGTEYLLLIINDPAFAQTVFAKLMTGSGKDELPLMWDGYSAPKAA